MIIEQQSNLPKNNSIVLSLPPTKSLKDLIEFTDSSSLTPILVATKNNNLSILKLIVAEGGNLYVHCSQLQNALHQAVINGNEDMVRYLVEADSESMILKNEVNYRNLKPEDLDKSKRFFKIFNNIWESAFKKTQNGLERLSDILKHECSSEYNALS